jgi:hypothetical protein
MEVLAAAALAVAALGLAGCYAPAVRDCTVSCDGPGDCASGQVCGRDGMCAAPEVAGRCAMVAPDAGTDTQIPMRDAGVPRDAAPVPDARPDAMPTTVRLTVQIMGKGSVVLDGSTTCSSEAPQKGMCSYDVGSGVAITAQAMPIQLDQQFAMWTSMTCAGQGSRCTFTPTAVTTISARFDKFGSHAP